jgi:hypothetical protein
MKRSAALLWLTLGLFFSLAAAQGGGSKKVTVTLVRWPYT